MIKKVVIQIICGLLVAALLSGCGPTFQTIELTEQNASSEVDLREGDLIRLSLAGNPTTGYTWEWVDDGSGVLEIQGEPEYTTDSDLVGSGGMFVFKFKAVKTGQAELNLIYHRTFEEGVDPIQKFNATVTVQ